MIFKKFMALMVSFFMTVPAISKDTLEIIAPFPPGGSNDLFARYISDALNKNGFSSLVINRPGADGLIGLSSARNAKDNKTLVVASSGAALYAPLMSKHIEIDILNEFRPITMLFKDSMYIVVPAQSKYNTINELAQDLQKNPNSITYASGHAVGFYGCNLFLDKIKAQAIHVPYPGGPAQVLSVAGGHTDFSCAMGVDIHPFIQSNRIKLLAVAGTHRNRNYPDVPTLTEKGISVILESWGVLLAHKNATDGFIDEVNRIISDTIRNDNTSILINGRTAPWTTTPGEAHNFLKKQYETMRPMIEKYQYRK